MKRILHINKGFTIIELMVAISLFLVLCSFVLKQFVVNIFNFKSEVSRLREEIYSISAIRTLEELIKEADANSLNIDANKITYNFRGNRREIMIEKDFSNENNIIINYYDAFGNRVTKKYIEKNLNYFSVTEKGKVIYINMENNKGSVYNKCLGEK